MSNKIDCMTMKLKNESRKEDRMERAMKSFAHYVKTQYVDELGKKVQKQKSSSAGSGAGSDVRTCKFLSPILRSRVLGNETRRAG